MEVPKIIKDISNERFEPYLLRCNGDQNKAFKLYEYNVKVSQSFYAPLSALEVTLRNKIDKSFKEHFSDDFWLRNAYLLLWVNKQQTLRKSMHSVKSP